VGNRLRDAERAQLDYDLATLRRRFSRAFLNGDTAEITRTRAEITELEGRRDDEPDMSKWAFFERPALTTPACLVGYPAMSVPTGLGNGGLPVAMQIIAKPFAEPMLFRTAHAYEQAHVWRTQRPAIAG
jgi:aspartyl-tRNA(Asn)/glutamyl-tRNA(Gln) amidotransferase subunit A